MNKYNGNESNAWALIYNQCSPKLKNKLEDTNGYDNAKSSNDIIKLLTMIRGYCCQFDTLNDEYMSIVKSLKNLFYFFQKTEQTNSEFHEDFMALVEVIEEYGGTGSLIYFPNMIKKELLSKHITDPSQASADELKEAKGIVRGNKFLAALMLNGANASKYSELKRSMAENYVTGTNKYPESPEVVLRIFNAYQPPAGGNQRKQEAGAGTDEGAMFAQTDNDNWKNDIECYKCGKKGHFARECTKKKTKEVEQMHATIAKEEGQDLDEGENIFVQNGGTRGGVNRSYVLLDNQSTVNQIANPSLLANIRKTKNPITVHCNNGSSYTNLEGDLGRMTVYHNPYGIVNVLLLKSTKAKHRVTYNSWDCDGVFKVHTKDGIVEFKPSEKGLHYHNTSEDSSNFECMLVNTVRDNFEGHTKHDIAKAKESRRLQGMVGNPTDKEFKGMVREKLITKNCPVTVQDVENANRIFGPDLANLRGKTIRTKPEHVHIEYVQIPRDFVELHKYVTLVADVMFVNGLPFLVTSS